MESTDQGSAPSSFYYRLRLTVWRSLVVIAAVLAITAFVLQWRPGLVLDFFRHGSGLDRLVVVVFILIFFPPLAERLQLPGILGLILGGILLGPSLLALVPANSPTGNLLSELGRVFLMFLIGLEINLKEFRQRAGPAALFGLATFALPLLGGVAVGQIFGYSLNSSILIGSLLASHTLLGFPILERLGLARQEFSTITIGATIFTDIASLLVLAVCVQVHVVGFSQNQLEWQLAELVIYCLIVLGGIPWLGAVYLRRHPNEETPQFVALFAALLLSAVGAKVIHLEDIVGAFLCGIAVNQILGHSPAREKIEFLGKVIFVPLFFVLIGVNLDVLGFARSLTSNTLLVLAVLAALLAGKFLAARLAGLVSHYSRETVLTMWSLSLPQVAATLAAAVVAYGTKNAAGERLIDEPILNSVLVVMVVTSTLGPTLTQRIGQRLASSASSTPPTAPRQSQS